MRTKQNVTAGLLILAAGLAWTVTVPRSTEAG